MSNVESQSEAHLAPEAVREKGKQCISPEITQPTRSTIPSKGPSKRPRQEVEDILEKMSRGEPDDDNNDERCLVKQRAREEEMPWFNQSGSTSRRSSCIETVKLSGNLVKTSAGLNPSYGLPTTYQKGSPLPNGTESSEGNLSISTNSFHPCTISSLMRRERDTWEMLKSFLPLQNQNARSKRGESGQQYSVDSSKESPSFSPTGEMNMPTMSKGYLLQSKPTPIRGSSYLTKPCGIESEEDKTSSSPTTRNSRTSARPSCMQMELNTEATDLPKGNLQKVEVAVNPVEERKIPVKGSMVRMGVNSPKKNVTTSTYARDVEKEGMEKPIANLRAIKEVGYGMAPKYLRYNLWDPDSDFTPSTADWTETALPLSDPPQSEFDNPVVAKTIHENTHLFKVVTPIKVDVFESYLTRHPNKPFVASICKGLREGFWPWASTLKEGYPSIVDESKPSPSDLQKADFLRSQRDVEIAKGRFSKSFGGDLLPGMYSMPIYVVPKPNQSNHCLVTDQSCGKYSLNSMINHDKVTGFPLDNMAHFGEMLMDLEKKEPGKRQIAWKSDVAEAYQILPMHPLWQIKQINMIDGKRHVDRCNAFGGCGSGGIFIAFNGLVAWIAKKEKGIEYLMNYSDDSSGCCLEGKMELYPPYQKSYPRDQVILM